LQIHCPHNNLALGLEKSKTCTGQFTSFKDITPWSILVRTHHIRGLAIFILTTHSLLLLEAQDKFEVQVYESELAAVGETELEIHTLFIQHSSTRGRQPSHHRVSRFTSHSNSPGDSQRKLSWAVISFSRSVPGGLTEFAGFPQLQYEPNHVSLEVRPIIDRRVGRWRLIQSRVLHSTGRRTAKAWNLSRR
jgi:hypothetical protein